ncbi:transmembrane protein 17-like [Sitodiplosis mosellana]|uniref:transmembrane protein 17-like n=1 Tax=Sitodiplosis mosellana TaxID=263140 RepID=UPI0024452E1A|nr:transmembrane protein 17-like [Sitodiplosis mosellana]
MAEPISIGSSTVKENRISFFEHRNKIIEIPNSASLTLQILLFTNVYLSPVWILSSLQFFYMNAFDESGKHNTIILGGALFLIAAPLEICRLYLGYSGNLREKIADFAGFLILSTFIQQPIEIFFFYIVHKAKVFWLQIFVQLLATALVFLQIVIGYVAMRRMTQLKAQQFHILTLIEQSNKNR